MKENDKLLYKTMKSLLNERLSDAEAESLKDEGFNIKDPTRKTAVMIALYKKAASGDLSAIKELRSIISEKETEKKGKRQSGGDNRRYRKLNYRKLSAAGTMNTGTATSVTGY